MATVASLKAGYGIFNQLTSEKPHSSITDWVEILSSEKYAVDDYDGIPELVESVNILGREGTTEASRAVRKKLKYGNVHRQLRALTILKALVENCGAQFQAGFADARLTDRIKLLSADPMTDDAVRRRLLAVLASWHRQFKDDPKMSTAANLFFACGGGKKAPEKRHSTSTSSAEKRASYSYSAANNSPPADSHTLWEQHQRLAEEEARLRQERKRLAKEEEKRRAREEKEEKEKEQRRRAEERSAALRRAQTGGGTAAGGAAQRTRKPFDFEKEKPQILTSIASASQASNNLVNALKLVNREKETVQANPRVQDCLGKAKLARKAVVRYIQLTENEEVIGTLLETNERIIAAIQLYDQMSKSAEHDSDDDHPPPPDPTEAARARLERARIDETEIDKLQVRQRDRIARAASSDLHPDLRDLSFGAPLSSATRDVLPSPLRPNTDADDERAYGLGGSLSDYSDYDSEDEEVRAGPSRGASGSAHAPLPASTSAAGGRRGYEDLVEHRGDARVGLLVDTSDPFADPDDGVSTPGIHEKRVQWGE